MKIRIIIIFFLIKMNMFCQSGSLTNSNNEISNQIPVLSPQSPTTSELGKYGEVQVNESTGVITPTIPIFDYVAGKMKLPITLNYSGNAVKVLQDPSWTGINWNLNPGGIITRVVKDRPDELTPDNLRFYYKIADLDNFSGARETTNYNGMIKYTRTTEWYLKIDLIDYNKNADSEVDIFNYNFLGYSGSFYLDKNNIVHLIKYDIELEITFNYFADNKSSFRIKTPDGNNYYFGGPEASESSKTCIINGASSCSHTFSLPYSQNAFYIYQIAFLEGGMINFEYTQNGSNDCSYKIGVQESASMITGPVTPSLDIAPPREIKNLVENTVSLKKITSSMTNLFVEFQTSVINKCASIFKLNNVYIKSKSVLGVESLIKKVALKYLSENNEINTSLNKFFLEKVEFYDSQNQFINKYELIYKSMELLPSKNSNAQDELGIYNGKNTNLRLLPQSGYEYLDNAGGIRQLADREADLDSSLIGSLTKIVYPTGGFSKFEYELPYKDKKRMHTEHYFSVTASPNGLIASPSTPFGSITKYTSIYSPDNGDGDLIVTQPENISGTIFVNLTGLFTHHNKIELRLMKISSSGPIQEFLICSYGNLPIYGGDASFNFNYTLQPGNYRFKLVIDKYMSGGGVNNIILGSVNLKLPGNLIDVYYPGLRVKSIQTYSNSKNSTPEIINYFYNKMDSLFIESYFFNPTYIYYTKQAGDIVINLIANSTTNIFNNDLGKYVYEYVTVGYNGFQNGGKEMRFYKDGNQGPIDYCVFDDFGSNSNDINYSSFVDVGTNQSHQNSILAEETLFNSNFTKLKNTQYNYQSTQKDFIGNMKIFTYTLNGNFFLYYETKSYNHRFISTLTKDFLTGITNPIETSITRNFTNNRVNFQVLLRLQIV